MTVMTRYYAYVDEKGVIRWIKQREEIYDKMQNVIGKRFCVKYINNDGSVVLTWKNNQPPLYNYDKILNDKNKVVFISEGEKCADSVQSLIEKAGITGCCSTTFPNGAASKKDVEKHKNVFKDKKQIVILADNDKPGVKAGRLVYNELVSYGIEEQKIDVVDFSKRLDGSLSPKSHDVADLIEDIIKNTNSSKEAFVKLMEYFEKNKIEKRNAS